MKAIQDSGRVKLGAGVGGVSKMIATKDAGRVKLGAGVGNLPRK